MSTYAPSAIQSTDLEPAGWFKVAQAFQSYAGVVDNGSPQTSPAQPDGIDSNLLRAAHALQSITL